MRYKIGKLGRRLAGAVGIATLAGTGTVVLLLAGGGTAMAAGNCIASTITPSDTNCTTTASVTVGSSTTIADNTPAITFTAPVSLPGPAQSTQNVSLTVNTNDSNGAMVTATPSGDMISGSNSIPIDCLAVTGSATGPSQGSGQPTNFGGTGAGPCPSSTGEVATTAVTTDIFSGVTSSTYNDVYSLEVPNVPAGTYSTTITYAVSGR